MLYSILIYVSEDLVGALTKEEDDDHVARHMQLHEKLAAQGKLGPCVGRSRQFEGRAVHQGEPASAESSVSR